MAIALLRTSLLHKMLSGFWRIISMAYLFWSTVSAWSQTTSSRGTLSGVVQESKAHEPLSGAVIKLLDAQGVVRRGSISTKDGSFTIDRLYELPSGTYTLSATLLGFKTRKQSFVLDNTAPQIAGVALLLESDPVRSQEVVVSGQGLGMERRRVSTNTAVVTAAELEQSPVPRFEQVLQAQLPNAQLSVRSGQPGATSLVRVRGVNSLVVGSTPVIYVDGIRADNLNARAALATNVSSFRIYDPVSYQSTHTSSLADIPMENIERVEFITGGAATTMYGSDAANGVIQIFTKQGLGRPVGLTVETNLGVDIATTQFLRFRRTAEALYRPGFTQRYAISGTGGGADWGYSFAASARLGEGFRIANSQYAEYDVRLGLTAHVLPALRYTSSFGFSANSYQRARDGNAGNYTPLWVVDDGFAFAFGFPSNIDTMSTDRFRQFQAFVRRAEELTNIRIGVNRFQTSQAFEWNPIPSLSLKALGGIDYRQSAERVIQTNEFLAHIGAVPAGTTNRGTIDEVQRSFAGLTFELTGQHRAEFTTALGMFSLISSLGGQFFRTDDNQVRLFGDNVRDGATTISGAGVQTGEQFRQGVANYGVYILENLGLSDRYFLEFGIRADGNTAFGRDVGVQVFPKIGVSYVMSDEVWFESLREAVSLLRLRANYGVAGNFPPPFLRDRTISFASYNGQPAAGFGQPDNPTLRPERVHTTEIGFDAAIAGSALALSATWYNARTRDALMRVPNALSQPEPTMLRNIGEILNQGVELRLSTQIAPSPDVSLQGSVSFNTVFNRVESAGGTLPFVIGGFDPIQNVVAEGSPVGFLRGSQALVSLSDSSYTINRLAYLGTTIPPVFGSISLSLTLWNALHLTVTSDYQSGAFAHSFDRQFQFLLGIGDGRVPNEVLTKAERQGIQRNQLWLNFTNYFVERTDFWRVRLIALQYDLPQWMTEHVGKQVSVGISLANPFGWTASSFDPEAANAGSTQGNATISGASYGIDSMPRTIVGTVKIKL